MWRILLSAGSSSALSKRRQGKWIRMDHIHPDGTPCEFIWLIKNAAFIVTDSFHASVFSFIYDIVIFRNTVVVCSQSQSVNFSFFCCNLFSKLKVFSSISAFNSALFTCIEPKTSSQSISSTTRFSQLVLHSLPIRSFIVSDWTQVQITSKSQLDENLHTSTKGK